MYTNVPRGGVGAARGSGLPGQLARLAGVIALLCLLASPLAFGQANAALPQTGQNARAPLSHLYWHFLLYQAHLDKAAAAREQQGRDGSWLRNHYQQRLGFTDSEYALVRESAVQLESDLKRIDAEVQAVIEADRAQHSRVLGSPNDLPPVPQRLLELRDERERMIQRDVDSLKGVLGPKLAAKLDSFLESEFAPNVTVQHVGPPRPHNPVTHAVPPFPAEVQR
jgi:hypothetical protein